MEISSSELDRPRVCAFYIGSDCQITFTKVPLVTIPPILCEFPHLPTHLLELDTIKLLNFANPKGVKYLPFFGSAFFFNCG